MENNEIIDVESKIGYCFNDKRLLIQAFTSIDVANELKISHKTIRNYIQYLCNAFAF